MAKDPKLGTGKKPKGSGRRLYTDENPKDTVGIKFATLGEQRAKVMGKNKVASIFKSGKNSIRKQHGKKRA
jgi:hypothetical protein